MLIVHASDLHLDSPLVGLEAYDGCPREALRGATRRALANLVDIALEEQASLVLVAGDLYDGAWRDHSTGLYFVSQMTRLRAADIPVVVLRGNHDAESQITKHIRLPDNVKELSTKAPETIVFERLGVAVHGQGFAVRDVREDLARKYPQAVPGHVNIGMLHTAMSGREGHEPYAPTTLQVIEDRGYDYWALGHVHRHEIVSRAPFVVYPGNLQGRHIRETGPKGLVLVTAETGRITGVEPRVVDVVRWADCSVALGADSSRASTLTAVEAALRAAVAEAEGRLVAARVVVTGTTRAHAELAKAPDAFAADVRSIALDVGGEGLWVGDVTLKTRLALDVAAMEGSTDPLALLVRAAGEAASDEAVARELAATLADLAGKLPEELRSDPALRFLDDPKELPAILRDVEDTLLALLVTKGEEAAE